MGINEWILLIFTPILVILFSIQRLMVRVENYLDIIIQLIIRHSAENKRETVSAQEVVDSLASKKGPDSAQSVIDGLASKKGPDSAQKKTGVGKEEKFKNLEKGQEDGKQI